MSKLGKDPTKPSYYRPFVLASVICKVKERTVNVRLFDFFDKKKKHFPHYNKEPEPNEQLSTILCTWNKGKANTELVVSILFDMDKAYDLTRKHGIMMDVNEAGKEG